MLKAADEAIGKARAHLLTDRDGELWPNDMKRIAIEAALLWQRENPPVPTDGEVTNAGIKANGFCPNQSAKLEGFRYGVVWMVEWVRRIYDAPEPEVPDEIKCFLATKPHNFLSDELVDAHNRELIEVFHLGQKSKP